jgi:hypothetical protein
MKPQKKTRQTTGSGGEQGGHLRLRAQPGRAVPIVCASPLIHHLKNKNPLAPENRGDIVCLDKQTYHQRGKEIMAQGLVAFKYEEE